MTTLLERPKVQEAPQELRVEPPVPKTPPPGKHEMASKRTGRWIRWMVVAVVVAMAGGLALFALRDSETEVTGTSHPLAEIRVADTFVGTSHPLAEIRVADTVVLVTGASHPLAEVPVPTGASHPLAEIRVADTVVLVTGTSHPLAEVPVPTGTSHPLAEISPE